MYKIGIDISLNSTGITIIDNNNIKHFVFSTTYSKYHKDISNNINVIVIPKYVKNKDYSKNEINKLLYYKDIVDIIMSYLTPFLGDLSNVNIEGYSYNSRSNSLLDIVCFSTLLRSKILDYNQFRIISPMTLKSSVKKGTKTKNDMLNNYLESEMINNCYLKDYLLANPKICKLKTIPNPFTDLIDSHFLCLL
jgi:hypothetical protein